MLSLRLAKLMCEYWWLNKIGSSYLFSHAKTFIRCEKVWKFSVTCSDIEWARVFCARFECPFHISFFYVFLFRSLFRFRWTVSLSLVTSHRQLVPTRVSITTAECDSKQRKRVAAEMTFPNDERDVGYVNLYKEQRNRLPVPLVCNSIASSIVGVANCLSDFVYCVYKWVAVDYVSRLIFQITSISLIHYPRSTVCTHFINCVDKIAHKLTRNGWIYWFTWAIDCLKCMGHGHVNRFDSYQKPE